MRRILIGGIGNVLLQDDGIGPYAVRTLVSRYHFESDVEVADLGTPGLDLSDYLAGRDAVILIDAVKRELSPGTIVLFRKQELFSDEVAPRVGPHAPSLEETLLNVDLMGCAPAEFLLIGVVGQVYDMGCGMSRQVQLSVDSVIEEVLRELDRLNVRYEVELSGGEPDIWWARQDQAST
jgi:hydrogenase maturation protease